LNKLQKVLDAERQEAYNKVKRGRGSVVLYLSSAVAVARTYARFVAPGVLSRPQ